ncbi:MAG: universal stress protein [Flavobacteriaceae bacterium]
MKTNRNKYKLVVLTDLNPSTKTVLKSAIGLAKMIGGEIEVFHVKKPSEIVDSENQLSAMRTINSKHRTIHKEFQSLIRPLSEEYNMKIPYSFRFGNVKHEIDDFIKEIKPDILVLGKRRSKPFTLIGDGITEYILKTFKGVVLINSDKEVLVPNKENSFGALNSPKPFSDLEFAEDLIKHTQKPLKAFKLVKNSNAVRDTSETLDVKTIDYVFEHNDSSIQNLSNYLSKNNISILTIDRAGQDPDSEQKFITPNINSVISKLETTLLISGK